MANVIEKTGKTVDEAVQAAAAEFGVAASEVEYEILETPTKRLFGLFGETPAKIRASIKVSEPPPVVEEPATVAVEGSARTVEETIQPAQPEQPAIEPILEPSPVEEPADEAEFEKAVDAAKNFLREVFAAMQLEATIEVEETEESVKLNLSGKGLGILIGRRGQALDALQYLLNLAVNRKSEEKFFFTLDVEDYRRRREEALIKLAKGVAERAIKTRREVRLEPMSRHERKIIHTILQDNDRVETHSTGEEPYRYVIVTPVKRGRR